MNSMGSVEEDSASTSTNGTHANVDESESDEEGDEQGDERVTSLEEEADVLSELGKSIHTRHSSSASRVASPTSSPKRPNSAR